ncbi:carboxylesterase family protein [Corynebacterium breve]|uniref:Carboxylic ester hydrolase n=1 Tax=Corynebacterium breve TaxID=3049799 RepID=A0ABY8VCQ0_9CORY|nr:carboxylesterase family protein [Corynebacterium breve]WIM67107.1 carboxylesterase family protein [Corynebacterium breve]
MQAAEVTCPAGTVVGISDGVVDTFHSIPFLRTAAPFMDAEPAHTGILIDASQPRPDDIALTITTPAGASDTNDYPVIAYIHGGRFESGTHEDPRADGYANATQGIVQVQIGYRVGLEGFTRFPGDTPHHYRGIDDCNLALEWIQKNIEAFGGDPTNVTIVGQSAGATTALWLARKDHYRGAFRRIVAMSPCFPRQSYDDRKSDLSFAFGGMRLSRENLSKASPQRRLRAYKRFRNRHLLDMALGPHPLAPQEMADVDVVISSVRDEFYMNPPAQFADRIGLGALFARTLGRAMGIAPGQVSNWLGDARAMSPRNIAGRLIGDATIRRWVDIVAHEAPGRVWHAELHPDDRNPADHSRDIRPLFGAKPYSAGEGLNGWLVKYARTGEAGWPEFEKERNQSTLIVDLSGRNATVAQDPLGYIRQAFARLDSPQ